jgi:chromosome partitioning protein
MQTVLNITLLAKKGGVGKSTLSILLFEAFRQAGKAVTLHDWDVQGTSTKALALLATDPHARTPEIVIFDTPPNLDHTATATAVRHADLVLVVTSPSPADIWEAEDAVHFVHGRNATAIVRVAFNKVQKGTLLGRLVEASAKQLSVPALPTTLSARQCYQHAVGQGWKALDSPAREEVLQLAVAVLALPSYTPQTTQSKQTQYYEPL